MKRKKRYMVLFLLMIFSVFFITACSEKDERPDEQNDLLDDVDENDEITNDTVVLIVNENETTYGEILFYFRSYKQKIELLYGSDIWNYQLDEQGMTYADQMKEQILEEIKYIKIVCSQAELLDIALGEDEKLDLKEYTADYMSHFDATDLTYYDIEEDTVKKIYEENIVANKIYEWLTLNIDTDVDEDEARHIILQYIFVAKYAYDDEGNEIEYTDDDLEEIKLYVEELYEKTETEDFYQLAKEYSDVEDEIEIVVSKGEMRPELEAIVFQLKDDEISDIIENEEGYFIIYCVSENDEVLTEQAKIEIILERQQEAFFESYSKWETDATVELNEEVWGIIDFNDMK